jgi:hypothetical protein
MSSSILYWCWSRSRPHRQQRHRIDSSGALKLGTTGTTTAILETYMADTSTHAFFKGTTYGIRIGHDSTSSFIDGVTAGITDFAPLTFNAKTHLAFKMNSAEVARIDSSGNFVIGGTNALAKFNVVASDNTSTTSLRVERSSQDYGATLSINGATGNSSVNALGGGSRLGYWNNSTRRDTARSHGKRGSGDS